MQGKHKITATMVLKAGVVKFMLVNIVLRLAFNATFIFFNKSIKFTSPMVLLSK